MPDFLTAEYALTPELRGLLAAVSPRTVGRIEGDDPFIFYGITKEKPMCNRILLEGLKEACRAAGIEPVNRGIVFHSHRHYYAARMADRMSAEQVSRITGHKSKAVFEEYAGHIITENPEAAGAIGAEVFGNIINFRKGAQDGQV
jgi:integrase